MEGDLVLGVDVGSKSVRASLVTTKGVILKKSVQPLKVYNTSAYHYEQSSEEIWEQTCAAVKEVCEKVDAGRVKGIGFDATCSLVVMSKYFSPVPVSVTGDSSSNVIMWMDHRANCESDVINETKHSVLNNVGGKMSPEMQLPKLLWLKRNNPSWHKCEHFMDLADFMTWAATGSLERSQCTLGCKWTYQTEGEKSGWSPDFMKLIDLYELSQDNYSKIGNKVLPPGKAVGRGLTNKAASQMCLKPGTAVAASLIDAHAGAVGVIGCQVDHVSESFTTRLALICGTSTCHLIVSEEPKYIPGVWGPYHDAMIPGLWLTEAGQSSTGGLLDHILKSHPEYNNVFCSATASEDDIYYRLHELLREAMMERETKSMAELTRDVHVWPDFHGNRSPLADPHMHGMISGLTLDNSQQSLAVLYLATIQALAYQTRHIISVLMEHGHVIESVHMCGGLAKVPLFVQEHADILGVPVVLPDEPESVLLGSAMLAACAANLFPDIQSAMKEMGGSGKVIWPSETDRSYHGKKYSVFMKMMEDQLAYRNMMSSGKKRQH